MCHTGRLDPDPFDVVQGRGEHSRTMIKTFGGDNFGKHYPNGLIARNMLRGSTFAKPNLIPVLLLLTVYLTTLSARFPILDFRFWILDFNLIGLLYRLGLRRWAES